MAIMPENIRPLDSEDLQFRSGSDHYSQLWPLFLSSGHYSQ